MDKMRCWIVIFLLNILMLRSVICTAQCVPKIAIIGGGIGGASASHFLSNYFGNNLEIDLYETYKIGGRLATITIESREYEMGGAIIHNRNQLMRHFAKELKLEERPYSGGEQLAAIWNGEELVFQESSYETITLAKLLYRYGLQPFHLYRHVNSILDDFAKIYDHFDNEVAYANVTSLLTAMNSNFPKMLQVSIEDYLTNLGYSSSFIDELVKATLVVNYGQGTDVQSFVGFVSVAGAGSSLWSIKGGNRKVPEKLIERNKKIHVKSSTVREITYSVKDDGYIQYILHYSTDNSEVMSDVYDIVIIATPLTQDHQSIKFNNFPNNVIFEFPGEYQTTYATFVKGTLKPSYFGMEESIDAILSCDPNRTIVSSVGKLSTVEGENSNIWKIFTRTHCERELIDKMFENVERIVEKKWKAYPKYTTNVFTNKFQLHDGLYYVNSIEWAASAMEMSAIGGKNVAILAYKEYKQKCNDLQSQVKKRKLTQAIKSEL